MEYPLVSVIMPVFNASDYLDEAIKSILNQTYNHFEFLIINDGSTDNSEEIIKRYNDQRIKLHNNSKNLGVIESLNYGLTIAKGKYIARMDADDFSFPKRLQKQVEQLELYENIGIVATYTQNKKRFNLYRSKKINSQEIKSRLLFDNLLPHPTIMFKTEILKKHLLYYESDYLHAEDYAFWLKAIQYTEFGLIQEQLLYYREHPNQISKQKRAIQINSVERAQKNIFLKLRISPNKDELSLHNKLFYLDYSYELKFLVACEQWLLKLKEANEITQLYSVKDFNNILAWTWFEVCTDFASKKIFCKKIFKNSQLFSPNVYSQYFLLKFEVKSWFAKKST